MWEIPRENERLEPESRHMFETEHNVPIWVPAVIFQGARVED